MGPRGRKKWLLFWIILRSTWVFRSPKSRQLISDKFFDANQVFGPQSQKPDSNAQLAVFGFTAALTGIIHQAHDFTSHLNGGFSFLQGKFQKNLGSILQVDAGFNEKARGTQVCG